jgi:hypothetical protein
MTNPTSFEEFWPSYLKAHRDPRSRALHFVGTVSGLACGAAFLVTRNPKWAVAGVLVAYGAAWTGHALFERNTPATFTHPLWSLRGDFRMLRLALVGAAGRLTANR